MGNTLVEAINHQIRDLRRRRLANSRGKILFMPLEQKINIFSPSCNIFFFLVIKISEDDKEETEDEMEELEMWVLSF